MTCQKIFRTILGLQVQDFLHPFYKVWPAEAGHDKAGSLADLPCFQWVVLATLQGLLGNHNLHVSWDIVIQVPNKNWTTSGTLTPQPFASLAPAQDYNWSFFAVAPSCRKMPSKGAASLAGSARHMHQLLGRDRHVQPGESGRTCAFFWVGWDPTLNENLIGI